MSDDEHLIRCAFVEGLHNLSYHFWSHDAQKWLQLQSTALDIEDEAGVSTVIDNAKTLYRQALLSTGTGNSVSRYRQMLQHQDYVLAPYLSANENFRSRRLVSRLRCGCHGFHVDLKPGEQKVNRESAFVLFVALTQQKMNVTFALHVVQSGTDLLPFSSPYCVCFLDFT